MGKDIRIAVRVTAMEKEKIQAKARKCGLSTTEYVKQRALGYKPRVVPPDALFACLEKVFEGGKDFKNQPDVINRNFLDHGMMTKKVRKKDCIQLFLLYYNMLELLDMIY